MNMRERWKAVAILMIALLAVSGCRGPMTANSNPGPGTGGTPVSPLNRVIVVVLQNHSFDSLFATYPGLQNPLTPSSPGYTQPSATSGTVTSYLLTDPFPSDMPHG